MLYAYGETFLCLLTDMFMLVRLLSCLLRTTTTMFPNLNLLYVTLMVSKIFTIKASTLRHHACHYCKYAMQNELVDDILTDTIHNDFA